MLVRGQEDGTILACRIFGEAGGVLDTNRTIIGNLVGLLNGADRTKK